MCRDRRNLLFPQFYIQGRYKGSDVDTAKNERKKTANSERKNTANFERKDAANSEKTDRTIKKKPDTENKSFLILFLFLFSSLFLVSILAVFSLIGQTSAISGTSIRTSDDAAGFSCEYAEAEKLMPFSDGVLKVASDKISFLSIMGTERYTVPVSLSNPKCVISNRYAVVFDYNSYFCSIFDEKGQVFQKQLSGEITYAAVSESGISAFVLEQQDTKGVVQVLDAKGNISASWESRDSGFPVGVTFSEEGDVLNISLVNADALVLQAYLRQLSVRTLEDGTVAVENLGSFTLPSGTVFPILVPFSDDRIFLGSTSEVVHIRDGRIESSDPLSFPQIYSLFPSGDGVAVLFSEGVNQEIRFSRVSPSLQKEIDSFLGNSLISTAIYDRFLLVAIDDKLIKLDMQTGVEITTLHMEEPVIRVGFLDAQAAVVVTETGVREIIF